jgi:hypothetical protein
MGEDPQLWGLGVRITLKCMVWSRLFGFKSHLCTWRVLLLTGFSPLNVGLGLLPGMRFAL